MAFGRRDKVQENKTVDTLSQENLQDMRKKIAEVDADLRTTYPPGAFYLCTLLDLIKLQQDMILELSNKIDRTIFAKL